MRRAIEKELERQITRLWQTQALIDELVALLDAWDGDADREPLLGSPELPPFVWGSGIGREVSQVQWAAGAFDDREDDQCAA
ncbi:hypothetical protein OSH10_05030 [Kaistia defluvii]|uniref:hypothetical protein n=1 Tax=Kaistia defluvii TaxID=410841 RepID=UPI0022579AA3|nr:hypothetical protein [Kaistia defluvii]MCX5517790.1 hypothetical protein [Kaistia defluvii]